uniref:Alpha-galactosidase n=1 Tax=Opuntia streptacantha TaxID=393608 RepID=A0A7C9A2G4_OPUST
MRISLYYIILLFCLDKFFPQLDSNEGPHRQCNLTIDEQKTQMTLWSMAKSPIMFGGDMRRLDSMTYGLITNPVLLEINSFSSNNHECSCLLSVDHRPPVALIK